MSTTTFEFGDIVLVPFPYTSQAASKRRPAVVVSNVAYNKTMPDVVVMAVTSQLNSAGSPKGIHVRDWQAAGLLKPSAIKPVFATLEQALIIRALGKLQSRDEKQLRLMVQKVLC